MSKSRDRTTCLVRSHMSKSCNSSGTKYPARMPRRNSLFLFHDHYHLGYGERAPQLSPSLFTLTATGHALLFSSPLVYSTLSISTLLYSTSLIVISLFRHDVHVITAAVMDPGWLAPPTCTVLYRCGLVYECGQGPRLDYAPSHDRGTQTNPCLAQPSLA